MNLKKVHPECLNELTIELAHTSGRMPGARYEDVYEVARLSIRRRHVTDTLEFVKSMLTQK